MKSLIFLIAQIFASSAYADNLSCKNMDAAFPDDTLEFYQEGATTYAYYFDGDSNFDLPCETTALDGYHCEDGSLSVSMDESGFTTVERSDGSEIEFNCF